MEIIFKNQMTSLKNIKCGECFIFKEELYIKTDYASETDLDSNNTLCVRLFDGYSKYIDDHEEVSRALNAVVTL